MPAACLTTISTNAQINSLDQALVVNFDILFSFDNNNLLDEIELFQWKGVTYQEGKKVKSVTKKVKSVVTVSDALGTLKEQLYPFSYHMYVYIVQLHLSKCQNHGVVD